MLTVNISGHSRCLKLPANQNQTYEDLLDLPGCIQLVQKLSEKPELHITGIDAEAANSCTSTKQALYWHKAIIGSSEHLVTCYKHVPEPGRRTQLAQWLCSSDEWLHPTPTVYCEGDTTLFLLHNTCSRGSVLFFDSSLPLPSWKSGPLLILAMILLTSFV